MSSAYKRHGQIIEAALLECLKDCARLRVWREDEFKLSHESSRQLRLHEGLERYVSVELEYGDHERTIPIDIIAFDSSASILTAYNVKRGNGSYDGGKRKLIRDNLLRTQMLLKDYGRKLGIEAQEARVRIIFYYGVLSLPRPLALAGAELDAHFAFPVMQSIEEVNTSFRERLHAL